MLKEMKKYIDLFEKRRFRSLVLSAKSSDVLRTIEVNRAIAQNFDYPIHIGLTHAGLPEDAKLPSAVALGTLLAEGVGDTIRVSLAGDPVAEVRMAQRTACITWPVSENRAGIDRVPDLRPCANRRGESGEKS